MVDAFKQNPPAGAFVTLPRETLEKAKNALAQKKPMQWEPIELEKLVEELQAVLENQQFPLAEIWWDSSHNCDWQLKMLAEPSCRQGVRIPLYAGDYEPAPVMFISPDGSFTVGYDEDKGTAKP